MDWLAKQHEATSKRAPIVAATEVNILEHDKRTRNIVESIEAEQRCKFIVDLLVKKEALAIDVKRQHRDRRKT